MAAGCALGERSERSERTGGAGEGRWVGHYESSLGPLGCPSRGVMEVAIKGGKIVGEARGDTFVMTVSGELGPSGEVREGLFRRDTRAAAIVTGTFANKSAAGRWQGASCEGVWSLRRVS
jgi:hypothetical protein